MSNCGSGFGASQDPRAATHPCYSGQAHHFFARMHLAVAPACNIQCNYCNRKYDCANESRPGVISERLKPHEALRKVYQVAQKVKELSVIGIAGPGDALANPARTFKTMALIKEHFPDLTLCLSTNGLALPDHADALAEAGVGHVTVTLNTFDPDTGLKIYDWVLVNGKRERSRKAMAWFLLRQQEGIRLLAARGVLVKVNSVLIPGMNDEELPAIAKKLKLMGVFMHNIMPLIAKPEHGTAFGIARRPEPEPQMVERVREACGDIKQMAHCRQCRADAVGKLGEDGFAQFNKKDFMAGELPADNGRERRAAWKEKIGAFLEERGSRATTPLSPSNGEGVLVAAVTKGMGLVNQHFGHAKEFHIYRVAKGEARFINIRKVEQNFCEGPSTCGDEESLLEKIIGTIADCRAVVCLQIGYGPHKQLEKRGVQPVTDLPYLPIEQAVVRAAERIKPLKSANNERRAI